MKNPHSCDCHTKRKSVSESLDMSFVSPGMPDKIPFFGKDKKSTVPVSGQGEGRARKRLAGQSGLTHYGE